MDEADEFFRLHPELAIKLYKNSNFRVMCFSATFLDMEKILQKVCGKDVNRPWIKVKNGIFKGRDLAHTSSTFFDLTSCVQAESQSEWFPQIDKPKSKFDHPITYMFKKDEQYSEHNTEAC